VPSPPRQLEQARPVDRNAVLMTNTRQMSLVGFMQAGSTTVYAGSWRHPATDHGFLDARYYAELG
jgi:hypothetical protein